MLNHVQGDRVGMIVAGRAEKERVSHEGDREKAQKKNVRGCRGNIKQAGGGEVRGLTPSYRVQLSQRVESGSARVT